MATNPLKIVSLRAGFMTNIQKCVNHSDESYMVVYLQDVKPSHTKNDNYNVTIKISLKIKIKSSKRIAEFYRTWFPPRNKTI